jgi:hypothetical protein
MQLRIGIMLLPVALISCSSVMEPDWKQQPAVIAFYDGRSIVPYTDLVLPDTVNAGAPFEVRFATHAGNLCIREDQTLIRYSHQLADITPYDSVPYPESCLDGLQQFRRTVTLRFPSPGKATVRLHGAPTVAGPALIERTVIVR